VDQKDNKKGDIIDGLLFFGKENSDPIQFSDYPETVVGTLRIFYNTWKIPSYIIPSKKLKSKFEEWINQLTDLNGICPNGEKMNRAMQMAKEDFDRFPKQFMIVRPASIRTLLINSVRKINDENSLSTEPEEVIEVVEVASVENKKSALKNLKSMLKEKKD